MRALIAGSLTACLLQERRLSAVSETLQPHRTSRVKCELQVELQVELFVDALCRMCQCVLIPLPHFSALPLFFFFFQLERKKNLKSMPQQQQQQR